MNQAAASGNNTIKNVIVLGIGNRLMEDDGVGNDIVEELKRRKAFPSLRLLAGETDTDYCLDEMEGAKHVILIDAANMGKEPGSVTVLSLKKILEELSFSHSSHHFDLLHVMKQQNYKGDGLLLAVEAYSIQYHLGLSSQMEAQLPRIVDEVSKHIKSYLGLYKFIFFI